MQGKPQLAEALSQHVAHHHMQRNFSFHSKRVQLAIERKFKFDVEKRKSKIKARAKKNKKPSTMRGMGRSEFELNCKWWGRFGCDVSGDFMASN